MARVILVRHGRTEANTAGVLAGRGEAQLDDHGRHQAAQLAEDLIGVDLYAAVASPMARTRQTLDLLLPQPGDTPVHYDEGVAEVDYGEWTGKTLKELAEHPLWTAVQRHPSSVTFPQGESMARMSARAVAAVRRWVDEADTVANAVAAESAPTDGQPATSNRVPTILIVSHGDIIKAIVADALGLHLDAFQRICVDPCSVSVVHYHQGQPMVECVNATGSVVRSWRNLSVPAVQAVPGGGAGR